MIREYKIRTKYISLWYCRRTAEWACLLTCHQLALSDFVGDSGTGSCGLCEIGAEDQARSGYSMGLAFLPLRLLEGLSTAKISHQSGPLALA